MSEQPPRRPRDEEFEARFADIVSNWDIDEPIHRPGTTSEPESAYPVVRDEPHDVLPTGRRHDVEAAADDADVPQTRDDDPAPPPPADPPRSADPRAVFGATPAESGWRVHVPPPEPDDDFVPGPVAPLPRGDLGFWGAMVGLVAGPLWLIYLVVFHRDDGHFPMLLAILLTVAGFALMVWRLPTRRHDDDSDDGAVV